MHQNKYDIYIILGIPFIFAVYLLLKQGPHFIDDAYYYLNVAYNVSHGNGLSFDGINSTNGFHPLWMLILIPLSFIISNKFILVYASSILQIVLFVISGYILLKIVKRLTQGVYLTSLSGFLFLWNIWFIHKCGMSGMETGVLLLILGLSYYSILTYVDNDTAITVPSLLLALLTMARIEMIIFVCIVPIALRLSKINVRNKMILLFPSFVYLIIYFGINKIFFNHFLPISAYLKSNQKISADNIFSITNATILINSLFGKLVQLVTLNYNMHYMFSILIFCLLISVSFIVYHRMKLNKADKSIIFFLILHTIFSVSLILFYCVSLSGSPVNYPTYYWFPIIYGMILVLIIGLSTISNKILRFGIISIMIISQTIFNFTYIDELSQNPFYSLRRADIPDYKGIQYLNENIPNNCIIGSWDAGLIGYYCNKPVINLDGLVNNYEIVPYIRDRRMGEYVSQKHISYIAGPNIDNERKLLRNIDRGFNYQRVFYDSILSKYWQTRYTVSHGYYKTYESGKWDFSIYQIIRK